jgi:hypothetical protein
MSKENAGPEQPYLVQRRKHRLLEGKNLPTMMPWSFIVKLKSQTTRKALLGATQNGNWHTILAEEWDRQRQAEVARECCPCGHPPAVHLKNQQGVLAERKPETGNYQCSISSKSSIPTHF